MSEPVTTTTTERPNIWSMAVVHQFYRREFELAPRIVRDLTATDHERQERAAHWFATTVAMMRHHHDVEDELMYPLLVGRMPQPLLNRMAEQHHMLDRVVADVEALLAAWRLDDPASSAALAEGYDRLLPVLIEHLDHEELELMPYVAELLTAEEYGRQGVSGNAFEPRTLMMAFGAMVEQADDHEAAVMLSHPPEPVRRAWRETGEAEYRALMHMLRAGLVPIGRPVRHYPESSAAGRPTS